MNNGITYKRVKINWWVFIFFGGFQLWILLSIHDDISQMSELVVPISIITWLLVFIFIGRLEVIINDSYVILRSGVWIPMKIPIPKIESVCIVKLNLWDVSMRRLNLWGNIEKYEFDAVRQAIRIEMKNGKVYKIAIKDAQIIKEEIEKRMLQPNKYSAE